MINISQEKLEQMLAQLLGNTLQNSKPPKQETKLEENEGDVENFLAAIQKGDIKSIKHFSTKVDPGLIEGVFGSEFSDIIPKNKEWTAMQFAVKVNQLKVVQYLYGTKADKTMDANKNTLLMLAAESGHTDIVKFLLTQPDQDITAQNRVGETALTLAAKNKKPETEQYLMLALKEQKEEHFLHIPQKGLTRASFVAPLPESDDKSFREIITLKGMCLILNYYSEKDKKPYKVFIADTGDSFLHALSLLKLCNEGTEYIVITRYAGHIMPVKCERYSNQNHFVILDSIGDVMTQTISDMNDPSVKNYVDGLINNILPLFKNEDPKSNFVHRNFHHRQNGGMICNTFTLKDQRKMLRIPALHKGLLEKWRVDSKIVGGVTLCRYNMPPDFMYLTESPDTLNKYLESYQEKDKVLRKSKQDEPQTLLQYALHPRKGHGVESPEKVKNRNYSPNKSKEPEYVFKNRTVYYFHAKYISIIDKKLAFKGTESSQEILAQQEALANIVNAYDAGKLEVRNGEVVIASHNRNTKVMN